MAAQPNEYDEADQPSKFGNIRTKAIKTPNIAKSRFGTRNRFSLPPAFDTQFDLPPSDQLGPPSSYIAASSYNGRTRIIQGHTGAHFKFRSPPKTLHKPITDEYHKFFISRRNFGTKRFSTNLPKFI